MSTRSKATALITREHSGPEGAEQRLKELGIKLPVPPEPFGTKGRWRKSSALPGRRPQTWPPCGLLAHGRRTGRFVSLQQDPSH